MYISTCDYIDDIALKRSPQLHIDPTRLGPGDPGDPATRPYWPRLASPAAPSAAGSVPR